MSYRDLSEYGDEELKEEIERRRRRSLKNDRALPVGLRIAALDVAWWLLLPVAWPAWAICCLYSEIGNRRTVIEAQKS